MVVHLCFGPDDKDLLAWKKALPKMTFSWYVREIIRAEKKRMVLELPLETVAVEDGERYETKIYFTGKEDISFIRTIPKGKRNKRIKEVIRQHLEVNRKYIASQSECIGETMGEPDDDAPNVDTSDEYEEMLRRMAGK